MGCCGVLKMCITHILLRFPRRGGRGLGSRQGVEVFLWLWEQVLWVAGAPSFSPGRVEVQCAEQAWSSWCLSHLSALAGPSLECGDCTGPCTLAVRIEWWAENLISIGLHT
jgi:hypothetical protein